AGRRLGAAQDLGRRRGVAVPERRHHVESGTAEPLLADVMPHVARGALEQRAHGERRVDVLVVIAELVTPDVAPAGDQRERLHRVGSWWSAGGGVNTRRGG